LFRLFWRFVDALHPARGNYPGLYAHYDRMMARPAVQKTLQAEAAVG
jgi:glutathione S-transferase